jgi:hypothetical protein
MSDWNQAIIDEFRANTGRVGGSFEGRTLLLLHHRGAKTGIERVNPLAYQRLNDDSVAVFARRAAIRRTLIGITTLWRTLTPKSRSAPIAFRCAPAWRKGDERDRIFEKQKADWDGFAEYEEKLEGIALIPVVVLEAVRAQLSLHGAKRSRHPAKPPPKSALGRSTASSLTCPGTSFVNRGVYARVRGLC